MIQKKSKNSPAKTDLKGLSAIETAEWVKEHSMDLYRGRQIREWLFKKDMATFDEMTNLSQPVRMLLKNKANLTHLTIVKVETSEDTTQKFLFRLKDGLFIESVLIPEKDHFTICVSSQAGCPMACRFCLTAKQGFKRNLTPAEIVDQIIKVRQSMDNPAKLTNIVFMGMGEPLLNYHNIVRAIENIIGNDGMNFSRRKVTVSTCGLVPFILKLGQDTHVKLAVSLNAADDKTRNFLMPVNKKYPLKSLISSCRNFPLPNREMITFEYILIKGINDRKKDAMNIVRLLSGLKAKINLIALNPGPGLDMAPSSQKEILAFREILIKNHYTAIIRKSKGQDISAACGQLSGKEE
ncbi:MAG: 23S rRNA (adenine(2503)-C(2))-methyltransferase RlmN [Deltaproteobacteria bacterium]|nr:23S rRNA (adenine(2503)-C(2))-methyltransferase RlmN [Deltaproteobacteria bacterium]